MEEDDDDILLATPIIVCAACCYKNVILTGARHWDYMMNTTYEQLRSSKVWDGLIKPPSTTEFVQGFIDQFNNFYDREYAMKVVLNSGQPFNAERNGSNPDKLYSEGLY